MQKDPLFKAVLILLLLILTFYGLFHARTFLIPVLVAALLAMVLLPLSKKLEARKVPRFLSIIICLLLIILIVTGFIFLFYTQIMSFSGDIPLFKVKAVEKFESLQAIIESKTNITSKQQMSYFKAAYQRLFDSSDVFIKELLIAITEGVTVFMLIIIYIFLFLFYRERFKIFILKLSPGDNEKVIEIINKTKGLTQHYLIGLLIELTILGTLNAVGLLVLGIKQAIFFGYLAGFLNIIPYVGAMLGSLFPIFVALIFKDSFSSVMAVAGLMAANQFIDNNFLTPKIIGSHVQINPLATIMVIIIGGLLWGIPGMILFIPILGIIKIVCDNVDPLKPYGYLFGDDESDKKASAISMKVKKMFVRNKRFPQP